jgi:hypothetical protein
MRHGMTLVIRVDLMRETAAAFPEELKLSGSQD